MTRVRGGTAGTLSAIISGRLDPFDGQLAEERNPPRLSGLIRWRRPHGEKERRKQLVKRSTI